MFRLLLLAMASSLLTPWFQAIAPYDHVEPPLPSAPVADPSPTVTAESDFDVWQPVAPRLVVQAEGSTKVALTFNSASYPTPLPAILETLRDAGVRCTFFLTGDFADSYPELVAQMARDGHEIGNHGDTHADLTTISDAEIVSELEGLDAKVFAITGKSTRPWLRPASGAYNDHVVQVAAQQGYYTIYWTADSADWRPEIDSATVKERLLRYAAPGAILVQHLTSPQSAEVLPEVLRLLKERGFELGTVSELLGTLK